MQKFDVFCLQQVHRDETKYTPTVDGMKLVSEIPHKRYDSTIFVRNNLNVNTVEISNVDNVEIITELENCSITSVYKPPSSTFNSHPTSSFHSICLSLGILKATLPHGATIFAQK